MRRMTNLSLRVRRERGRRKEKRRVTKEQVDGRWKRETIRKWREETLQGQHRRGVIRQWVNMIAIP